ncbi:fatty acyl-CoA reductase wat-like [Drosophila kikkawai]|uniref:Fatty acyl-CoA reductase n=1 Tax=Drosophila kikkawai TaxID=30033 RepID=A0A6P4I0D7_DROKI|nr:fatty acyl-CoA reductase wat-like [Drosophila kikkawai]
MEPGIPEFFKNKTVFLTGGSGFLGKVATEKLLRTTEVKRIYSLIRPKRGVSIEGRTSAWEKDPIFEVLLQAQPKALQRVTPIAGDCLEPDLGISEKDRKLLVNEVQVVIHGAATVRFDEAMHLSLAINVRATRLMLQLAKQMSQLVAFVHISTAYSNCVLTDIDERFYPENLKDDSDTILALSELLSDETLDSMTSTLVGSYPNTYTYTKALAEDVIRRESGDLPICIFRPAIVMPTYKDPLLGWADNLFGPLALIYGGARGIVRVVMAYNHVKIAVVPADYCANLTLACAWELGVKSKKETPPIYTLAPTETNHITYGSFIELLVVNRDNTPLSHMIWYPYILLVSPYLFPLATIFYHKIPGYFFDTLLRLTGRKPILTKLYQKVHKNIEVVRLFTTTTFNFGMTNTQRLLNTLTERDRSSYDFDMHRVDWNEYLRLCIDGIRRYIAKDPKNPESLAKALKLKDRLKYLHYAHALSLGIAVSYAVWTLVKLFI